MLNSLLLNPVNEKVVTYDAVVTAYAPHDNQSGICNDGNPNSTSTGTYPKHGAIAVDPNEIPYGSKIYVPGYGWGIAEDTGGALRNDKENIRIDVFKSSYTDAIVFGKQNLVIIVIEEE